MSISHVTVHGQVYCIAVWLVHSLLCFSHVTVHAAHENVYASLAGYQLPTGTGAEASALQDCKASIAHKQLVHLLQM